MTTNDLRHWYFRKLYLAHERYIYLHSLGWTRTKAAHKKSECEVCGFQRSLELHHVNYQGAPKPKLWHFLFIWMRYLLFVRVDNQSKFRTLCHYHHERLK